MRGPEQENSMSNSSPSIAENSDGSERFSSLKQPFQSFIPAGFHNSNLERGKGKATKPQESRTHRERSTEVKLLGL